MQNDLLDLGADLSVTGETAASASGCGSPPSTPSGWSGRATRSTPRSPPLRSFVIPGGTPAAAHLHVCRTVCRRAERRALAVEDANPEAVRYLNRLSDLLFILARAVNERDAGRSRCGTPARTRPPRPPSSV